MAERIPQTTRKIRCLQASDAIAFDIPEKGEWIGYLEKIPNIPVHTGDFLLKPDEEDQKKFSVPVVTRGGEIFNYYLRAEFGIRPICTFKYLGKKFEPGEKVFVGNVLCTALEGNKVMSDLIVSFSNYGNISDYNESDIKKLLDSDEFAEVF